MIRAGRLVTLLGAPGVGKSRLALQSAAAVPDEFRDGAWLVELAPLADPGLVPRAVADALGVAEPAGHSLIAALTSYLRAHRLLLVLDNCEHVVGSAAALAETLLRGCPTLHILATSREPLAIEGEVTHRVPSLRLPPMPAPASSEGAAVASDAPRPDSPAASEAVRLFAERARAASPTFALTDRNATLVAQICARLDGIPLAIELAAARVRALSVEQISLRLDDRFRLLTGGSRTALPRQQTLRGAVDWSYDLLSAAEQALLRRLAVFAGGFTLEAAEEIVGAGGQHPGGRAAPSPVETLVGLADKSLVQVEEEHGGAWRYRLLETLREYGLEKLAAHGELADARSRHRNYFVAFAEEVSPQLNERPDGAVLARIAREHDNLRAALSWSLGEPGASLGGTAAAYAAGDAGQESPGAALGLRLAAAVWRFWWLRGYLGEGHHWLARALTLAPSDTSSGGLAARSRALFGVANLSAYQGDYRAAIGHMTDNLTLCRQTENDLGIVSSLHRLGFFLAHVGELQRATDLCEESVALGRRVGHPSTLAMALNTSGIAAYMAGQYEQSIALSEEAIGLLRDPDNVAVIAYALRSQGQATADLGDPTRAAVLTEEGLRLSQEVSDRRGIGDSYKNLGRFALMRGDLDRAIEQLRMAIAIFEQLGDRWLISCSLYLLARVKQAQGAPPPSEDLGHQSEPDEALKGLLHAARLFAAAHQLREWSNVAAFPEIQTYERDLGRLRGQLGERAFEQAWDMGQAMSFEQAVEYALAVTAVTERTGGGNNTEAAETVRDVHAARLTPRERDVAALVARGMTNRQIAADLVLSLRTVDTHVHHILEKLGLGSRAQIAVWVTEQGLTGVL